MFSTVSPGRGLFLSFSPLHQSIMEGAFAIVIVVVLALPFVYQIQRLREDAQKGARNFHSVDQNCTLVTHYPNHEPSHESSSSSSILFDFTTIQDIQPSQSNRLTNNDFLRPFDNLDGPKPPLMGSSFCIESNIETPLIEVSNFDYRAYRHKLLDEVLRKHYAERQPPGQVVMNSIHLNTIEGSKVNPKAYNQDIFEYVGKLYDSLEVIKAQDSQYMHPLDHFLMKGPKPESTEEKSVSTKSPSLWSVPDTVSDVILNSAKNVGDTLTHSKTPQAYRNRTDMSGRADHHARPLTAGESSSDLCSSINELNNDGRHRAPSNRDDRNIKRPWLVSLQPESFNRKYGKKNQNLIDKHWRTKSQGQHTSPPPTAGQVVAESSLTSLVSTTRDPSPSRLKTAPPTNSELKNQRMTNSGIHQTGRNVKKSPGDSRKPVDRNPESRSKGKASDMMARDSHKNSGGPPASSAIAVTPSVSSSVASTCSTVRLKTSRLPLHINSRKPINCFQRKDVETDFDKSRFLTCSMDSPAADPDTMQRPKTSCGAIRRVTTKNCDDEDPALRPTRGKKTTPRPRTCDGREAKGSFNADNEMDEDKGYNWIVKAPLRKKKERQEIAPRALVERLEDPLPNNYRNHSDLPVSRKGNSKIKVAMNRGIKSYIDRLRLLLVEMQHNNSNNGQFELDNLSISDILTDEIEPNLDTNQVAELRTMLQLAERQLALTNNNGNMY